MSKDKRIYIVTTAGARDPAGNEVPPRMVEAVNQHQALRHVVADSHTVELATQQQCIDLALAGVRVERPAATSAA